MPTRQRIEDAWKLVHRRFPTVDRNVYWLTLPDDTVEHLICYLAFGDPMDAFCEAVVANDFMRAGCQADSSNGPVLGFVAKWIKRSWPPRAFGTYARTELWRKDGGGAGRERAANA
jgi:hypothetical protein